MSAKITPDMNMVTSVNVPSLKNRSLGRCIRANRPPFVTAPTTPSNWGCFIILSITSPLQNSSSVTGANINSENVARSKAKANFGVP